MPKIHNKLLFLTNRYKPETGAAELDTSVCKLEEKPHPNLMRLLRMQPQQKIKARPQITRALE